MTTPAGINDELGPFVRMTVPRGRDPHDLLGVLERSEPPRRGALGRSWILLGGIVPIDFDDLYIAELEPGRGFCERSVLGSARSWSHDRRLLPLPGGGCRVVDEIGFEPRLSPLGALQAFVFEAMFRWRHRRLRRHFGALP